jgi:phospholipase/lecithinase/hemolysin
MHESLFVIETGSNDIFFQRSVSPAQVAEKIEVAVQRLRANGAWAFALVASPSLESTPWFRHVEADEQSRKTVAEFGDLMRFHIKRLVVRLQSRKHKLKVVRASFRPASCSLHRMQAFVDLHTVFARMVRSPLEFGFEEKTGQGCLRGVYAPLPSGQIEACAEPKRLLYYDEVRLAMVPEGRLLICAVSSVK